VKDEMLSSQFVIWKNVSDYYSDFVDVELKDMIMIVNSVNVVEI
jgi:hypothetical protein